LPFCHRRLTAAKPKSLNYSKELKTLGDHIRKRRYDLGFFQKQVAAQIGVDEITVYNWERNATSPRVRDIPRIIQFLGYNPLPAPDSLAEKLLAARKALGFTQKAMARRLRIDQTTLARLERGRDRRPLAETLRKISPLVRVYGEWMNRG
jgi:transcriptional regulator with XRE-family HTH domain